MEESANKHDTAQRFTIVVRTPAAVDMSGSEHGKLEVATINLAFWQGDGYDVSVVFILV